MPLNADQQHPPKNHVHDSTYSTYAIMLSFVFIGCFILYKLIKYMQNKQNPDTSFEFKENQDMDMQSESEIHDNQNRNQYAARNNNRLEMSQDNIYQQNNRDEENYNNNKPNNEQQEEYEEDEQPEFEIGDEGIDELNTNGKPLFLY